jgi:hypothetical protein
LFSYAENSYRNWRIKIPPKFNDLFTEIAFSLFPYLLLFSAEGYDHRQISPTQRFLRWLLLDYCLSVKMRCRAVLAVLCCWLIWVLERLSTE